ncbi:MAG TPA: dephospho-CoA kinase [Gemmatimonadales bacterium]|nr:dephospho-CoA kinase [Gemmatimonadales bacterium]
MLHVGLTGNIAAGKSTVAELFRGWGATVIDADEIVRQLQAPGSDVLAAIAARFGPAVLRPDGALDRPVLRARVLADPAELTALNAVMHPAVAARRRELVTAARRRGDRIVVSDIPLLFEADDPAAFDAIVLVDAPEPVRRARLAERRLPADEAERLMAAQQPSAEKRARSDYVIDNTGDLTALERAARAVWEALVARA